MTYRTIDEIPVGATVWVQFVPDAEGISDEDTAARVVGKSSCAVLLGMDTPDGGLEESAFELVEHHSECDTWTEIDGQAKVRLAPIRERTSSHTHCCRKCGWIATHALACGCREAYFWLCGDCEGPPSP